ncbi:MAG: PP2C family protein-serine/threonine phosphatase [Acidimicrobiales bacterium]
MDDQHMTVPEDTASPESSPTDVTPDVRDLLEVAVPPTTWRLLLVDDDEANHRLVRELLGRGLPGTTIDRVTTLSDACRDAVAADCVLLDIGLPDAEGTVGVKRLTQEAPDTAVVVLTGATSEELGAASLSAGAQDYLVKGRVDEQLLARSVRYAIERHRAAQLSRELVRAERQRAENVRLERALTPTPVIRSTDISVIVRYQAGRRGAQLGGDFYDAIEGDDGRCAVLVGDVVGHGPDAAALATRLRSAWRALALAGLDQVAILGVLDKYLRTEVDHFTFASLAILVVDEDRRVGSLVLAGHPPPVRLGSPSCPVRVGVHGPLVGVMPEPRWSSVEVDLGAGTELLLYTDGIIEGWADSAHAERLGVDVLIEVLDLLRARGLAGAALLDALIDEVQGRNGLPLRDDVALCLVGIPDR